MNIQEEVQKIHSKFGTSEMANYKIQLLFDKQNAKLLKQNEALVECLKELHSQTLYALDENDHRCSYTHKPSKLYDKIEELLNTLNK